MAMAEDYIEMPLDPAMMRHEAGLCWQVDLPADIAQGDGAGNPARSTLLLFENGQPLGPAHADHNRIRVRGGGIYSHWGRRLYFSTSDNADPTQPERRLSLRASRRAHGESAEPEQVRPSLLDRLAPELRHLSPSLSLDFLATAPRTADDRIQMLERKVEYLLDELYAAKSQLRHLTPLSPTLRKLQEYQIGTFDFQWGKLPYHDQFMSNPAWRGRAADDLCARLNRPREWLRGLRVLDCGCGPGRHAWTFASLGASVTAFDTSPTAVAAARRETMEFANVAVEQHNILDPLPYHQEFDVVWCYGVVHCTGDTYRALSNIAAAAKPGGMLYFMVYPEPERTNTDSYRYYHEVYVLRQLTRHLPFDQKAELMKKLQGERWALSWFDAISSEVNDLYTMEELTQLLGWLGFTDVTRTMPHEHSLNVTAIRTSG
jgi:2-polyprenyl-3-methyl-5-hydroxy-6-metoxy-1,4-benzoquinol methylase